MSYPLNHLAIADRLELFRNSKVGRARQYNVFTKSPLGIISVINVDIWVNETRQVILKIYDYVRLYRLKIMDQFFCFFVLYPPTQLIEHKC